MKISELRSPYRELAELRMTNKCAFDLFNAFSWNKTPEGSDFWRDVNALIYPAIPAESLKELQPEWVVGQEYEFSDGGKWSKRTLLAVLPENFKSRFITQTEKDPNIFTFWTYIRHIQPQVTELTLEDIAEKFGVSVETIKIKK